LYEDEWLLAVDKPAGLLVHRTAISSDRISLVQILRERWGEQLHPVHRLDRPTSGVLLFAKSGEIASIMGQQLMAGEWSKRYHAVVRGWVAPATLLDRALPGERHGKEDRSLPLQEAATEVRLVEQVELPIPHGSFPTVRYSLVEAAPITGRWRQIRRHFRQWRHPIVGDTAWGDLAHNRLWIQHLQSQRLLLNASALEFRHPRTGAMVTVRCPLTTDWAELLESAGFRSLLGRTAWDPPASEAQLSRPVVPPADC
jgi:tRNA pseudouridine65 synthase